MDFNEKSLHARAPRTSSLGAFLAREDVKTKLVTALGAPEDFDALEASDAAFGDDGRALALGTSVSACADGARKGVDEAWGVRLRARGGRETREESVEGEDGWSRLRRECRQSFFNALKESTYATHASASKAMTMSSESADALYEATVDGDFRRLHRAETLAREIAEGKKREVVPMRVYRVVEDDFSRATFTSAPASVEREGTTVSDGLRAFGVNMDDVDVVLSQGVRVDLGFDLASAHDVLRGCDNFLHLVVHAKKRDERSQIE